MAEAKTYKGLAAAMRLGRYLSMGGAVTTAPTTALEKGDLFVGWAGSVPRIGICTSAAAQTIKYIRTRSKTWGSATA
jgi:hypothetical protein